METFPLFLIAESQNGAYQNREGVERRRLREQKEGSGGAFGCSGERTAAGGILQRGGYLRVAASSPTSLFGEDHGNYSHLCLVTAACHAFMREF